MTKVVADSGQCRKTNKQTSKQASKQASKQTSKQTNMQQLGGVLDTPGGHTVEPSMPQIWPQWNTFLDISGPCSPWWVHVEVNLAQIGLKLPHVGPNLGPNPSRANLGQVDPKMTPSFEYVAPKCNHGWFYAGHTSEIPRSGPPPLPKLTTAATFYGPPTRVTRLTMFCADGFWDYTFSQTWIVLYSFIFFWLKN